MKKLLAIITLLFLCNCSFSGNMDLVSRFNRAKSVFNYSERGPIILVQGVYSSGEYFEGTIKTAKQVKAEQNKQFGNYFQNLLTREYMASATLQGSLGNQMVCSIKQQKANDFSKGGLGTCYISDGEVADVIVYDSRPPGFFSRTNSPLLR